MSEPFINCSFNFIQKEVTVEGFSNEKFSLYQYKKVIRFASFSGGSLHQRKFHIKSQILHINL